MKENFLSLAQTIRERKTIRKFKDVPVSNEEIRDLVALAAEAPSASNRQMWKFVAVKDKELIQRMGQDVADKFVEVLGEVGEARLFYYTLFKDAPLVIAVFMEPYRDVVTEKLEEQGCSYEEISELRGRPDYQTIGAAIENLSLAAHAKGYGSCWMTAAPMAGKEIREVLKVEEDYVLAAVVAVGIPDHDSKKPRRKPLDEILTIIE